MFYEYFHGDNGAGLGASHQAGWTGLVAKMIQLFGLLDAKKFLEAGKAAAFDRGKSADVAVTEATAASRARRTRAEKKPVGAAVE